MESQETLLAPHHAQPQNRIEYRDDESGLDSRDLEEREESRGIRKRLDGERTLEQDEKYAYSYGNDVPDSTTLPYAKRCPEKEGQEWKQNEDEGREPSRLSGELNYDDHKN